ncbi:MAG: hypothetical protein OEY07_11595 [Gammaproteobacteria bacterium]|nr:hypothetical protein [Gammaproteobacteria bacterium]
MDFSYRDKQYIRNGLKIYLKHLQLHSEEDSVSDEKFSEMQDDIVWIRDLLFEIEKDLAEMKMNAPGGAKLYTLNTDEDNK